MKKNLSLYYVSSNNANLPEYVGKINKKTGDVTETYCPVSVTKGYHDHEDAIYHVDIEIDINCDNIIDWCYNEVSALMIFVKAKNEKTIVPFSPAAIVVSTSRLDEVVMLRKGFDEDGYPEYFDNTMRGNMHWVSYVLAYGEYARKRLN